ncbi:MAG: zinc ribbon domain-containing protein [Deltaproteobacteria bacterium]|nr:zinc ribbon domain-containing protein [Deltaproteobacteria bacterium]
MPIYEYECRCCGNEFEMIRSLKDDDAEVACPACSEKKAHKRISQVAGAGSSCGSCSSTSCSSSASG